PSPATVPPEPIPVQLLDADGAEVRAIAPDLLGSAPARLADSGRPPREVRDWSGPWPVRQRWWGAGSAAGPEVVVRVQVVLADGAALLLAHRGSGWWVTGVYD
ncbi:MAG: DNA polymerase Y family protein, partial [Pseudonocardia sp.]|nr:DNA polymerase Y family protein [Pseudonocardia sp.]